MDTPEQPEAPAPENAEASADRIETITLTRPVQRRGQTICEIALREPNAGELRGLDVQDLVTGDINALIAVVPRISMPPLLAQEVENFKPADIGQVAGVMRGFFMTGEEMAAVQKAFGIEANSIN